MSRKKLSKIKFLVCLFGGLITCIMTQCLSPHHVSAASCPDLKVIFVRGSGATRYDNEDYQTFKSALAEKLSLIDLTYEFDDLDYPAVGVGFDNIWTAAGAYFGGGDAYDFGNSVNKGVNELVRVVNTDCNSTKYVIAGYSQGAMVVSKALPSLNPERIIYAATFGDPKIYLPEGKAALTVKVASKNGLKTGTIPPACKGENLSNYRAYVPDCYAYEGLLGSYRPYQPDGFRDKLGTWCNKFDIFCSSYYDIGSHVSYISDKLYEDASKTIFSKIVSAFGGENTFTSTHDTAIIIDSTQSMHILIDQFRDEALRLTEKTLSSGGRIALYDYRDLADPYDLVEHCNFDTCTLDIVRSELEGLKLVGGGDDPESLLSAAFTTMNRLSWNYGATKSVVVLTDAGFHSPDLDGTTFADVVSLSKRIDPVNFYIITVPEIADEYTELANATDGLVATSLDDLSLLTDTIMARFDSLPTVEELEVNTIGAYIIDDEMPEITITDVEDNLDSSITIRFSNTGTRTLVALNDSILGLAEGDFVVISELNRNIQNQIRLIPLSDSRRGAAVEVLIGAVSTSEIVVPKAPDTGIVKSF